MDRAVLVGLVMLLILTVSPAASAAPEASPEGIAKWDGKLREQIKKAIKAGRKPSFHSKKMNMKVTVKKVDPSGNLWVATRAGMQFGVAWSRLVLSNKASLAITAAGDDEKGHAIAAFYLLVQGKGREAAPHLRRAGDAADEVRAASRALSAEEVKSGHGRAPAPRAPRKTKAGPSKRAGRPIPWDIAALSKAPKVHPTNERPANGMRSFFYEGADYEGKPTWVFAYYATPKGNPPAGGWPAVVCAHGGGGSAYPGWVRYWNGRGYAAISMDLEGHLPGGNHFGVQGNFPTGSGHKNAGPARIDWFGDRALPDKEQWFYHAVADVIRANSLLRAFPEINRKKIGLTGISWGGVIVCSVAGVDSRFAFVVPVYGAAFIHESDNPGLAQWFPPKNMTQKQFQDYRTKWDGAAHLPYAKMPMLFVTSIKDPVFQIDIFAKSAEAAGGPSAMCLRPWMIHGHGNGWNDPVEIQAFADSIVKGGPALPKLQRPEIKPGTGIVHTKFTGRDITEAWIYVTTSRGTWQARNWHFIQCSIGDKELVSHKRLPHGATAFFVYVFRDIGGYRSNHAASPLVVLK